MAASDRPIAAASWPARWRRSDGRRLWRGIVSRLFALAQNAANPRRIDIHHHFAPPRGSRR
jgi:hypothetical protein